MNGDRVRLRARSVEDAATLHELWSDVDTHMSASEEPFVPTSVAAVRSRIERGINEPVDRTGDVWMIAESMADGTVLGTAGLWGISSYEQFGHLAVTLLPAARGQGFGREVVALLCRYGFQLRNLRRLELETLASNQPMRRAAEAAGFVLEGMQRERAYLGDGFGDLAIYGLLRTEWRP